ncbi:L-valine transporter subunit YgaH [Escherichia coli]|nr:L-valine transporter subunit YgaH [Escherichia coli]MCZ4174203.1 L-valine transporter subunit YgaH [Escherichia coli]
MSYEVLLLGLLVGAANYCFRYLPLRLRVGNARPTKRGAVGILLDTIGIASICALLVVSTAPEVMHDTRRFVPTLVGFAVLGASFYKTRSIIIPTPVSYTHLLKKKKKKNKDITECATSQNESNYIGITK